MLGFVQNWLAPKANPIGIDFGSDSLRLAQVQMVGNEYHLIAAASADVPSHVRNDVGSRLCWFIETTRDLLAQGRFRGRTAILGLPAASMFIQHLRLPKMDDEAMKKALPWESRGKLPIDPSQALLRHLVAGEIYQEQEPRSEVIVMAAGRELVNQLLASAAKAKLDIVGMNVEPKALVDCFQHVYRRKNDADICSLFVDIGSVGTRAIIARGPKILFARTIPIGGDHLNRAVAQAMSIGLEEAKLLRIKLCAAQPSLDETRDKQQIAAAEPAADNSFALLSAGLNRAAGASGGSTQTQTLVETADSTDTDAPAVDVRTRQHARVVEKASLDVLNRMVEELGLCRRYHEATFPTSPVDRLIFVGGESKHRTLCQHIAREMGLAAQLGDPLVRMGRLSTIGIESGIDRRQPQPNWAVAIGLSMGPKSQMDVNDK